MKLNVPEIDDFAALADLLDLDNKSKVYIEPPNERFWFTLIDFPNSRDDIKGCHWLF